MKNAKTIVSILSIGLVLLAVYTGITNANSHKKLKKLTVEIKHNIDSIKVIQGKYDSVANKYNTIYMELNTTKQNLSNFKGKLDSVMELRLKNIIKLNNALDNVIEEQDSIEKRDSSSINFRLK